MLRRPDFPPAPNQQPASFGREWFAIAAIATSLLLTAWLSPAGTAVGILAAALITLFGVCTGWFVTYVVKLPRDERGFHERNEQPGEELPPVS